MFRLHLLFIALGLFPGALTAETDTAAELNLSLIVDSSHVLSGGQDGGTATRALLESGFTVDLERVAGIRGGELFAGVQMQRGRDGSAYAGDIQAYSNIDAEDFQHIGEAGLAQTLMDGRLRYRLGRLDANSDFSVLEPGAGFIQSSAGFTPAIATFPTYPDPVAGANLFFDPVPWFTIGAGRYDGRFTIGELQFAWNDEGRIVLGAWRDDELPDSTDDGLYATLEQALSPRLDLFLQYGSADRQVAEIESHIAAGLAADGLFRSRPGDTAGVYVTRAELSRELGFREDETALELFYGFAVSDAFVIKPDLQYIVNPSGNPAVDDAFVATIRLQFSL